MERYVRLLLVGLALLLGLAACAGNTVAPTSTPPPTTAPVQTEALAPASAGLYDDIPQGVTAEGYQYLGNPDADVTLVMYSDFL